MPHLALPYLTAPRPKLSLHSPARPSPQKCYLRLTVPGRAMPCPAGSRPCHKVITLTLPRLYQQDQTLPRSTLPGTTFIRHTIVSHALTAKALSMPYHAMPSLAPPDTTYPTQALTAKTLSTPCPVSPYRASPYIFTPDQTAPRPHHEFTSPVQSGRP